jgi:hypothetical protein
MRFLKKLAMPLLVGALVAGAAGAAAAASAGSGDSHRSPVASGFRYYNF